MLQALPYIFKDVKMFQNKILSICLFFLCVHAYLKADITVVGTLLPSSKSLISTQVSGRLEDIFVDVGSRVNKNQPLVQLDKRYYEIELAQKMAALEAAKLELADSEKNFLRMQKLWEKPQGETPSIPLKRFEEAQTKHAQSVTQVEQAQENYNKAQLNLEETTIKAPYDCIVTKKYAGIGESIPNQPVTNILEVQALDPLFLEFSIPQSYSDYLCLKCPITYEIEGMKLPRQSAQVDLLYPTLDESTRSLRCRAVLDNKDYRIRPGALVKVTLQIALPQGNGQ